jgi:hypothetical protein
MFPLWFTLFGDSFVFLDVGPSILFLVFLFFGCFGLFMIGRVSSSNCSKAKDKNTHSHSFVQDKNLLVPKLIKPYPTTTEKPTKRKKKQVPERECGSS